MSSLLVGLAILTSAIYILYHRIKLASPPAARNFAGLNVGHRGCRRFPGIAENTLTAFQFAIDNGADAFELDCRLTKDGHVIVFHDDYTFRLCHQANLRISDMTLAEVRKLTFKDASNSSERVPTLTQALQLAKKNSTTTRLIKVFVEIKCVEMWGPSAKLLAEKVAEVFKAENAHSFACVISFNPLVMYWLRVMDPIVECCMLYSTDFFASCIRHKLEKVPVWLPHIVWLLDPLLMQLCIRFFPELIGCTMVGPEAKIVSVADLKAYERRNLGVYVWVTNSLPEAAWYAFFKASYGTDVVFPKLVGPVLPKAIDPFNAGSLLPAPVALASPVDVVSSSSSTSSSPPTSPSINYSEANLTFASADVKASDEAATATSMFVPVVA